MAKADKMVGGKKVTLPRVEWSIEIKTDDDDPDAGDRIVISGSSPDAVCAALDANAARLSLRQSIKSDGVISSVTGGPDKADKRR